MAQPVQLHPTLNPLEKEKGHPSMAEQFPRRAADLRASVSRGARAAAAVGTESADGLRAFSIVGGASDSVHSRSTTDLDRTHAGSRPRLGQVLPEQWASPRGGPEILSCLWATPTLRDLTAGRTTPSP